MLRTIEMRIIALLITFLLAYSASGKFIISQNKRIAAFPGAEGFGQFAIDFDLELFFLKGVNFYLKFFNFNSINFANNDKNKY